MHTALDDQVSYELYHRHLSYELYGRYLTPMRAEWDPKDSYERMIVVGRCATMLLMRLAQSLKSGVRRMREFDPSDRSGV